MMQSRIKLHQAIQALTSSRIILSHYSILLLLAILRRDRKI